MGIGCGEVLEDLEFGGIWLHALGNECCTIEGNLGLPDWTLCAVEDSAMFYGGLHQAQEVLVMLIRDTAKYAYIIMYGNIAR